MSDGVTEERRELEEVEGERAPANERVERLQEVFDRTQAELAEAKGTRHELIYGRMSDIRRRKEEIAKALRAHQAEKLPQEKGPLVRSVWQQQRPSEEDYVQDTPRNMHFGAANVSDKPLSAGEDSSSGARETVVIPKAAREKLDRAG